jgi:hypothetical protein
MPKRITQFLRFIRDLPKRASSALRLRTLRKADIPKDLRDICARYGEDVIAMLLASGHNPRAKELQTIYQTDEAVEHARAWLAERSHSRQRREIVTLSLEVVVVGLIGLEILLGIWQAHLQSRNFEIQQHVLTNLENSSAATADTLQNSAQNFRDSAAAAKKQIEFLQKEKQDRDEAVLSTVYKELFFNENAFAENQKALETEVAAIRKEGKTLIGPINTLHTSAWELLRLYLPRQIGGKAAILGSVTEVYMLTHRINEVIRSREDYRIHNGSMSNFATRMAAYDEQLQELNAKILSLLGELLPTLKAMQKADAQQAAPKTSAQVGPA